MAVAGDWADGVVLDRWAGDGAGARGGGGGEGEARSESTVGLFAKHSNGGPASLLFGRANLGIFTDGYLDEEVRREAS